MRYIKHLFVRSFYQCAAPARLALLCAGFAALGGCTNETDSVGGSSTADGHIPLALEIMASGFTGQPDASPDTRASEQDNYDTWFEETDAIGLFAVRGIGTPVAAIVDGINNSKLTYAPADDASHKPTWQPADAATTLYYYADVTYIAYYPYKDGIAIDPTQSASTILASFSGKTELQPAADQSTPEAYAASDLMTASGTATDTADPSRKLLSLTFTHSYSLLVVKTNIMAPKYDAPDGSFKYHSRLRVAVADAIAANAVLNDVKAWKKTDGEFRSIVKPTGNNALSGSYERGGIIVEYSGTAGTATQNRQAGKYYELTVNATMPNTPATATRALKAGDFYYADGTVWPGGVAPEVEDAPMKESCIGVVFWVGDPGTGDAQGQGDALLASEHSGCTHGLVVSLTNVNTSTEHWSETAEAVNDWTNGSSGPGIDIRATDKYQGYSNTKALTAYNNNIRTSTPASLILPIESILAYRQATPAPVTSSDWYLPSVMELKYMLWGQGQAQPQTGAGRKLMKEQLLKIDQSYYLSGQPYWTSTEIDASLAYGIPGNEILTTLSKNAQYNTFNSLAILAF